MDDELVLKLADPWVEPISSALGILVGRAATARRHPSPNDLVIRPGGLGDTILCHLAVERVGLDPYALSWVVGPRGHLWCDLMGLPAAGHHEGPMSLFVELAGRFETVINTEQRFGLSQSLCRVAQRPSGRTWCFDTNRGATPSDGVVSYDSGEAHELGQFTRLFAAAYGLPVPDPIPTTRRVPSAGHLVVALGGGHAVTRAFGTDAWLDWIERESAGGDVVLAHGPTETTLGDQIVAALGPRVTDRTTSFRETVTAISTAERMLTIDGGMVHVGSYYGIPETAIFTAGNSAKWAPLAEGSTVVRRHDLACQPCTLFGQTPVCPNHLACMRIGDEQWAAVTPVRLSPVKA